MPFLQPHAIGPILVIIPVVFITMPRVLIAAGVLGLAAIRKLMQ
jgi:hypothetical protein